MGNKLILLLVWSVITVGPVSYLMRQIVRWRIKRTSRCSERYTCLFGQFFFSLGGEGFLNGFESVGIPFFIFSGARSNIGFFPDGI